MLEVSSQLFLIIWTNLKAQKTYRIPHRGKLGLSGYCAPLQLGLDFNLSLQQSGCDSCKEELRYFSLGLLCNDKTLLVGGFNPPKKY